jgi:hypothetical protein
MRLLPPALQVLIAMPRCDMDADALMDLIKGHQDYAQLVVSGRGRPQPASCCWPAWAGGGWLGLGLPGWLGLGLGLMLAGKRGQALGRDDGLDPAGRGFSLCTAAAASCIIQPPHCSLL